MSILSEHMESEDVTPMFLKTPFLTATEEARLLEALRDRDGALIQKREDGNKWRAVRSYELKPSLKGGVFFDHVTPMILTALHTGLRRGEIFTLTWDHIDLDMRVLTVDGQRAKTGKTRHVPLNAFIHKILSGWRIQNPKSNLVFESTVSGVAFNNIRKAWGSVLKKAGIHNFRWHDMRHHFASKLVMTGVHLNTVRELLGHSDIKMTLRYAHLAPHHTAQAVENLATGLTY